MTAEKVFLAHGRVRAVWRFFLSVPLVFFAMYLANATASFIARPEDMARWGRVVWSTLLLLPALLAAFKLLTAACDRKPLGSVGLAFCGRWRMEFGLGLGVGALMILSVAATETVLGAAQFSWSPVSPGRFLSWGGATLVLLLVAATNEELIFRGYPFQRLAESLGGPGAVALSSVLFGLMHLGNPSHSWISTLNTVLVGVPLAVSYLRTRALWMPVGIHFAWNFLQGFGLGLPISGFSVPLSALKAEVSGAPLLTGGSYGPEASILTTIVIVAATGYLWRTKSIYLSEEMHALVFGPVRAEVSAPETVVQLNISPEPEMTDRPKPT
ncbi:MAG: lysostaphin resistance A-like protein [Terriglobales bacterium]